MPKKKQTNPIVGCLFTLGALLITLLLFVWYGAFFTGLGHLWSEFLQALLDGAASY